MMTLEEIRTAVDEVVQQGIKSNQLRQDYEAQVKALKDEGQMMLEAGRSVSETAKYLHHKRRELGRIYKEASPGKFQKYVYEMTARKYGDPLGPDYDVLKKRKTDEEIIESSSRPIKDLNDRLSVDGYRQWLLETELPAYQLAAEAGLKLVYIDDVLSLTDGKLTICGDLSHMYKRISGGRLPHELLVKAAKLKGFEGIPVAIDATAGMGEDSMLLAAAGFEVTLYEYNPVIAVLLSDALRRAKEDPSIAEAAGRMHLIEGDSLKALADAYETADLILLDPMFPERQKSGMIKKKFQLLQRLEMPCADEDEMMTLAIKAHPRKIVVKRPAKGPYLGGVKPGYDIPGKAIRYDVYIYPDGGRRADPASGPDNEI